VWPRRRCEKTHFWEAGRHKGGGGGGEGKGVPKRFCGVDRHTWGRGLVKTERGVEVGGSSEECGGN